MTTIDMIDPGGGVETTLAVGDAAADVDGDCEAEVDGAVEPQPVMATKAASRTAKRDPADTSSIEDLQTGWCLR
jgi:hypothetical protein